MFLFGFELEGFFKILNGIAPPPIQYPTDGFPGLVELRTIGGASLNECYAKIVQLHLDTPGVDFALPEATFSRQDKGLLRRRHSEKTAWDIRNLYGRQPRLLGNKTIASFQLSVSNQLSPSYRDSEGKLKPAVYGLFDIPQIVRNLDAEFAAEIKAAGRQPGEYAVKDQMRLEYRSLPNSVFSFDADKARVFLARLQKAVSSI